MVQDLKVKLDKSKEEIGQIQGEVKFSQEAVHVKREQKTIVAHNEPLFDSSEKTAAASRSTSNEVNNYVNLSYLSSLIVFTTSTFWRKRASYIAIVVKW